MTFSARTALRLNVSALLVATALSSASAQDANAVASRLRDMLAQQGTDIAWAAVSGSGGTVTIEGVTVAAPGQPDRFNVGAVTLEGVTEQNGGYRIGTVRLPEYAITQEGISFEVKGATITGAVLPAAGSVDPMASFLFYDAADVTSVNVRLGDKQVFGLEGAHATMTPPAADQPMTFTFDVPKMSADLASIPDPKTKAVVEALGYPTITGSVKSAGSWNPADGTMTVTQSDLVVDNAATLSTTMDLSGYTPAFIKSMQDLQKQIAANPAEANNQAQGMAMLGLMQQLNFKSTAIKLTDASLTNKVIDYLAKRQGMKPADVINQAKAILPFGLAQLKNPELAAQVAEAVGKFLQDPRSLTISAKPAEPVSFAVLAAGGMADPTSLPKTLNVSVTAND